MIFGRGNGEQVRFELNCMRSIGVSSGYDKPAMECVCVESCLLVSKGTQLTIVVSKKMHGKYFFSFTRQGRILFLFTCHLSSWVIAPQFATSSFTRRSRQENK